jgi:hypothetical protein
MGLMRCSSEASGVTTQQKAPAEARAVAGEPGGGFRIGPDSNQAQAVQPIAGAVSATGVASAAARSSGKL